MRGRWKPDVVDRLTMTTAKRDAQRESAGSVAANQRA
jgi:hypothetical protein